jgi:hypothetical protein
VDAIYDWDLAQTALFNFIEELPSGMEDYLQGLRRMYEHLYNRAMENTDARMFVDKTPRYHLILPELRKIFPEARFILLFRNPLSVLTSVIRTWIGSDWLALAEYRSDLLEGPGFLLEEKESSRSSIEVRYEHMVQHPDHEIQRICDRLNVGFEPSMIEYGGGQNQSWEFGDPKTVHERERPEEASLRKWVNPESAQEWRLLKDYAGMLGPETFGRLGYDFEECMGTLNEIKPSVNKLRYTVSLDWLLQREKRERARWEYHAVNLFNVVGARGPTGVLHYIVDRLKSKLETGKYS